MAVPLPKLTPDEYLAIEREAEYKSEYFNGEMFARPGGSPNHSRICTRLIVALGSRLEEGGCEVFSSDLRIRTAAAGLYAYPDVTVVCGTPVIEDTDLLTNPRLIFEALSDSTEARDRGFKFRRYKQIPSLKEYVLVSQAEPYIEQFQRAADGEWTNYSEVRGLEAVLVLKSVGIEIPLAEIYRGIRFE